MNLSSITFIESRFASSTFLLAFAFVLLGCSPLGESKIEGGLDGTTAAVLPVVSISGTTSIIFENGSPVTFTVSLSKAGSASATIPITLAGTATSGTDYTLSPAIVGGAVTFAAGETTKTFTVTPIDDAVSDDAETIQVQIGTPTNATLSSTGLLTATIYQPALDLNFNALFNDGTTFAARAAPYSTITYTRTNSTTYVDADGLIKTALAGVPRFSHDPYTGQPRGLLVEASSTNSFQQSADFTLLTRTAIFAPGAGSVTNSTSSRAPDGSFASEKLIQDATLASEHSISKSVALATSTSMTGSFYVKPVGALTNVVFEIADGGSALNFISANYTLTGSGAVSGPTAGGTGSATSASIERYINGWYRCILSGTANSASVSATTTYTIKQVQGATTTTFNGDGASGFFVWGGQLENNPYASNYIITGGAASTRNPETISITNIAGFYSAAGGIVHTDFGNIGLNTNVANNQHTAAFHDGTINNRMDLNVRLAGTSSFKVTRSSGGVTTQSAELGTFTTSSTRYRNDLAFSNAGIYSSLNGVAAVSDTSFTMPANTFTNLGIGTAFSSTYNLRGSIARLAYYAAVPTTTTQLETWSDTTSYFRSITPAASLGVAALTVPASGATQSSFIVGLTEASASTVTVNWALTGTGVLNTDYSGPAATSGTFTFAPGEMKKFLTITGVAGATKTIIMTISAPTNATIGTISTSTMTLN